MCSEWNAHYKEDCAEKRKAWYRQMDFEHTGVPILANRNPAANAPDWKGNVILRGFASDPVQHDDPEYLAALDEHVSLAEANHVYVIFAWRSLCIDGAQPTSPGDSAQQALVKLAKRYWGKPNVMYALQVEPHDVAWSQLQPQYVQMVDAIHAASSPFKPIIMLPGIDYSRDVSGAINNPMKRENVVYKSHPYNAQTKFQQQFIAAHNAGLPVFIGEFGWLPGDNPNSNMNMPDVDALLSVARAPHNIGWAAWILDYDTGHTSLVTNDSTFDPTSPYGTTVKNEMTTTPPLPTDNGWTASIDDAAFHYTGTWQPGSGTAKFLGGDHYSDVGDSTYQVPFSGTQVRLYAATAPWHGIAAVSVDGSPETMVDFYSSSRVDQALVYTSPPLTGGSHVVTIRVTGMKNANSTGTVVTADRADVTASPLLMINDNTTGTGANHFQYTGVWSYAADSPTKYQGDDHFSNSSGSVAKITVSGTRIARQGQTVVATPPIG